MALKEMLMIDRMDTIYSGKEGRTKVGGALQLLGFHGGDESLGMDDGVKRYMVAWYYLDNGFLSYPWRFLYIFCFF